MAATTAGAGWQTATTWVSGPKMLAEVDDGLDVGGEVEIALGEGDDAGVAPVGDEDFEAGVDHVLHGTAEEGGVMAAHRGDEEDAGTGGAGLLEAEEADEGEVEDDLSSGRGSSPPRTVMTFHSGLPRGRRTSSATSAQATAARVPHVMKSGMRLGPWEPRSMVLAVRAIMRAGSMAAATASCMA